MIDKIYIFTSEPFPAGFAATNRIAAHARGFIQAGTNTEVVVFRKTENPGTVRNKLINGIYREVPYRYLSRSTSKASTFLGRRLDELVIYTRLLWYSFRVLRHNSISFYYSADTIPAIIVRISSWFRRCPLVKEENEYPGVYLIRMNRISRAFFRLLHYRIFDALILMTQQLVVHFQNEMKFKGPIIHIPMSVDISRFTLPGNDQKKLITYCGSLNDEKDGISLLISAFYLLKNNYPEYKLMLIGISDTLETAQSYISMVTNMGLSEDVIFYGQADPEAIPELLLRSSLLVLPRPQSVQAEFGFPTKLGEYLATGRPVVVTKVGEIPEYLTDNFHAFIAEPGDVDSFTEKMTEALQDQLKAREVGRNGREVVKTRFSNTTQAKLMIDWFEQLIK